MRDGVVAPFSHHHTAARITLRVSFPTTQSPPRDHVTEPFVVRPTTDGGASVVAGRELALVALSLYQMRGGATAAAGAVGRRCG